MTYLGFDVLDQTAHNMREAIAQSFDRHAGELNPNVGGRRFLDDFAGLPIPRRTFAWCARGRTRIGALFAFLDARQGRLNPFWTPTYCRELVMTQDALAAASSIVVSKVGYGQFLFPFIARRYLALLKPTGAFLIRKVSAVVDNGNGTETLTLTSSLGEDLAASTTLVSYLVLCRLDEDLIPYEASGADLVEALIPFREVPLEAPA